jgi:hypothetical protein
MHIDEMIKDANADRRLREIRTSDSSDQGEAVSGWRRGLSRGALRLGLAFDSAAEVLDPSLCLERIERIRAASRNRSMVA